VHVDRNLQREVTCASISTDSTHATDSKQACAAAAMQPRPTCLPLAGDGVVLGARRVVGDEPRELVCARGPRQQPYAHPASRGDAQPVQFW
jgi:hypothetical protein